MGCPVHQAILAGEATSLVYSRKVTELTEELAACHSRESDKDRQLRDALARVVRFLCCCCLSMVLYAPAFFVRIVLLV